MGKKNRKRSRDKTLNSSDEELFKSIKKEKLQVMNEDGEFFFPDGSSSDDSQKKKQNKKKRIEKLIDKTKDRKRFSSSDDLELPNFDPAQISTDPASVYTAVSQVISKISYTQKRLENVKKQVLSLILCLETYCKGQLKCLDQHVQDIRLENPTSGNLKQSQVIDFLTKFHKVTNKLQKLEPFLSFKVPKFGEKQKMLVKVQPIQLNIALSGIKYVIGRLQPFLKNEQKNVLPLGLIALNTKDQTVIGRFNYSNQFSNIGVKEESLNPELQEKDQTKIFSEAKVCLVEQIQDEVKVKREILPDQLESTDKSLTFQVRQFLPKLYRNAICHGNRLICDQDVYNKSYELIQTFLPHEVGVIHSLCSLNRDLLLAGTSAYFVLVLRWEVTDQIYKTIKRIRLERCKGTEGDITLVQRIHHLDNWVVACTLRTLRVFEIANHEVNPVMRNQRVVKEAIVKQLNRLEQINNLLITLCITCVNVISVTEDEAQILHTIRWESATNRVCIFPGFDFKNFPFVITQQRMQRNDDHTDDQGSTWKEKKCRKFIFREQEKYLAWQAHHLKIAVPEAEVHGISNVSPELYDYETDSMLAIDMEAGGVLVQISLAGAKSETTQTQFI